MANVHRLGEYSDDRNRRAGGYQSIPSDNGAVSFVVNNKVPFIYTPPDNTPPLD